MSLDIAPLIAEADHRAERIVALARMTSAGVYIAFFLISLAVTEPPPPPPEADLPSGLLFPRSWLGYGAITLTFSVGVLSYTLIRTGIYRPWMAWPFATLDVTVAAGSLAVSLMNSGLAGVFAPMSPALWATLIVLASGTLRYNPALQAYIGILATAALVAITVFIEAPVPLEMAGGGLDPVFHPGTPPTILRIAMFGFAALILTIAVARSRRTLTRAALEGTRRQTLARYLPREVASLLSDTDVDGMRRGRRDPVAVLFVDVRDFTTLTERMDGLDISALLTRYRSAVMDAAEATGGTVDKFIGDGAMVVFGMTAPDAKDAQGAIACARHILGTLDTHNRTSGRPPVRLAMGASWGTAFCGAVGDESRLEFTVLGDVVNVASRLEARAKAADAALVVDAELLSRAEINAPETEGWRHIGEERLRGRSAPSDLYALATD